MPSPHPRETVRTFYEAIATGDPRQLAALIDDDIDWVCFGPIHILPFFGPRRGRRAVARGHRMLIEAIEIRHYAADIMVAEGDRVAALLEAAFYHHHSGNLITCRLAHFLRVQAGKIVEFRCLVDSFDLVEQLIGRPLDIAPGGRPA